MAKHFVWVHSAMYDEEERYTPGAYRTLNRAKKILGGEWTKSAKGHYTRVEKTYSRERLTKAEVQ